MLEGGDGEWDGVGESPAEGLEALGLGEAEGVLELGNGLAFNVSRSVEKCLDKLCRRSAKKNKDVI